MSLTSIIERRKAQRRYFATDGPAHAISRRLHTSADPATRAGLLDALADIDAELARQHPAAWGPDPIEHENGRDMAESLASSASLLRHLADTERAVAAASWTPARDLKAGGRIWCEDRWAGLQTVTTGSGPVPGVVHAHIGPHGPTRVFGENDLVRTGGPDLTFVDVAATFGPAVSIAEITLWTELSLTADRDARAELIDQIADHAARRVGGQAAESLVSMAVAERDVAAGAIDAPHPQMPSRASIAVFFVVIGAMLVIPSHPVWALIALGLLLVGAAAGLVISAVGLRPDWATVWSCEQTGERLGSAAHVRAQAARCRPGSWRILPRIVRRTDATT
ncbi:hypothetical protein GCM10023191_101710 [Actinoallomurus oryzae]|uniref:Uncharacterized protein n=1 Tax=Actinoallomurus oryzae TaxID=502180 RepID=A0ABP8R9Z1_9ACTN